jgi:hypothetical protein
MLAEGEADHLLPGCPACGWNASAGDKEARPSAMPLPTVRELASRWRSPGATTLAPLQREILREDEIDVRHATSANEARE